MKQDKVASDMLGTSWVPIPTASQSRTRVCLQVCVTVSSGVVKASKAVHVVEKE